MKWMLPFDSETMDTRILTYKGAKVEVRSTIVIDTTHMDPAEEAELIASEPRAIHIVEAQEMDK